MSWWSRSSVVERSEDAVCVCYCVDVFRVVSSRDMAKWIVRLCDREVMYLEMNT
jgi:hypothetical protein